MSEEYLTVAEAAERLGISPRAVQKRCANGSLKAQRIGGQWQVLALDSLRTNEPKRTQDGSRTEPETNFSHSKRTEVRDANRTNEPQFANQNEPPADLRLGRLEGYQAAQFEQRLHDAIASAVQAATAPLMAQIEKMEATQRGANGALLDLLAKADTAPLLEELSTLRAQFERIEAGKLGQVGTENQTPIKAPETPEMPTADQSTANAKQSPIRGAQAKKLTTWQHVIARITGIR